MGAIQSGGNEAMVDRCDDVVFFTLSLNDECTTNPQDSQGRWLGSLAAGRQSYPARKGRRALETSWDVAKRLENPNHWPSLKSLDRAAAALGKNWRRRWRNRGMAEKPGGTSSWAARDGEFCKSMFKVFWSRSI
jgi:hypothetical protein